MKVSVSIAAMAAFIAAPAMANWGFSGWGSTPAEVASAVGDKAKIIRFEEENVLEGNPQLVAEKSSIEGIPVEIAYYFIPDDNALSIIDILPSVEDCDGLLKITESKYGPQKPKTGIIDLGENTLVIEEERRWIDPGSGNQVDFLAFRVAQTERHTLFCKIQIMP